MNKSVPNILIVSPVKLKYGCIICFSYFFIFGGLILRLLKVPVDVGLNIISISDIIPLFMWLILNPKFKINSFFFINSFSFWCIWVVISIFLLFADFRHHSGITNSLIHLGALIRYIPVAFMTVEVCKSLPRYASKLLHQLEVLSLIVVILGWISIILGEQADVLFPIMPEVNTAVRELKLGWHSAIFPNTIDLGFILNIFFLIWIYRQHLSKLKFISLSIIFAFPIYMTGSIAAFAMFCIVLICNIASRKRTLGVFLVVSLGFILSFLIFLYWDILVAVVENAQLSRLGILLNTLPDFISELSLDSFLGTGTGVDAVYNKVNSYNNKVFILQHMENLAGFGDVYWVALLVYHGILGCLLIYTIYYLIYKTLIRLEFQDNYYNYKAIVNWIFISIICLGVFNQVLTVRAFSYVFWILMAIIYSKGVGMSQIDKRK